MLLPEFLRGKNRYEKITKKKKKNDTKERGRKPDVLHASEARLVGTDNECY